MEEKLSASEIMRKLRKNLEYSQEYMASELDISQQAYSAIENDPERASLDRLKQISKILMVKVTTLIGEDEAYILDNFNQQGVQSAIQMNVANQDSSIYERYIADLQGQIANLNKQVDFLQNLTKK